MANELRTRLEIAEEARRLYQEGLDLQASIRKATELYKGKVKEDENNRHN